MIKGILPQLSECGKIKIGTLGPERATQGGKKWRPPVKLDHFLITKTSRGADGLFENDDALMRSIETDADGKIRAIPIILHSDEIDEVFPTSYAAYAGKTSYCRGDGETAIRKTYDKAGKETGQKQIACVCPLLDDGKCKPHGILHCSIAVPGLAIAGAVYKWRTTGIISIQRMIGSLQQILSLTGTLCGIPLWIKVQPVQVSHDGKMQTVYSCHIELRAKDLVEVQTRALEAKRIRESLGAGASVQYKMLVQAPAVGESPEESREIVAEFFTREEVAEEQVNPTTGEVTQSIKAMAKQQVVAQDIKPQPKPETKQEEVIDYGSPDNE